jgi:hypothetical protein
MGRVLLRMGDPGGRKGEAEKGMISPSRWTFYFDVRSKTGRVIRTEFTVVEDKAPLGNDELGSRIKKLIDTIQERNLIPYGAAPGRYGVYRGFKTVYNGRWLRHRGIQKYDLDRHYRRGFGGRASAG